MEINEIKELIKKRPRKALIQQAIRQSQRLSFHTLPAFTESSYDERYNAYASDFSAWVGSLIGDKDKKVVFDKILNNPPIPTNETLEKIWLKASRVWSANNASKEIIIDDPEKKEEFKEFLKDKKIYEFIKQIVWKTYQIDPNAFIVVDSNSEDSYTYVVNSDKLIDYKNDYYVTDYLIYEGVHDDFKDDKDEYKKVFYYVDDEKYIVIDSELEEYKEVRHNLGITPAYQVSTDCLYDKSFELKKNIITNSLGSLDKYLFNKICKDYQDTFKFLVVEKYEEHCSYKYYENNDSPFSCVGGNLVYSYDGEGYARGDVYKECPDCAKNKLVGAGTTYEKPLTIPDSQGNENVVNITDAVKFVNPDTGYLEYSDKDILNKESAIVANTIGVLHEEDNGAAKNEMQVEAGFENRKDVLLKLARNFEQVMEYLITIFGRIKASNDFIGVEVNMGDEFHLKTVKTLEEEYKLAKENGATQAELLQLREAIKQTKYRHSKDQRERLNIIEAIEPLSTLSTSEVLNLYEKGLINSQQFNDWSNFASYLKRFERENGDIVVFGNQREYNEKINIIKETIQDYGREQEGGQTTETTEDEVQVR